MKSSIHRHYILNIIYFLTVGTEVLAELFDLSQISLACRIMLPSILVVMYFTLSRKNDVLFYLLLLLHLLSNLLFFSTVKLLFSSGIFAFILVRVLALLMIFIKTKKKNYLQIVATSFPFLLIFFYLISVTDDISELEFNTLIIQSIMISLLAGVSVTNYFNHENKEHSWLLISTLLFIGLRFLVFIERYINADFTFSFNRPIGAVLNAFAFYAFYKYVIVSETEENDLVTV